MADKRTSNYESQEGPTSMEDESPIKANNAGQQAGIHTDDRSTYDHDDGSRKKKRR